MTRCEIQCKGANDGIHILHYVGIDLVEEHSEASHMASRRNEIPRCVNNALFARQSNDGEHSQPGPFQTNQNIAKFCGTQERNTVQVDEDQRTILAALRQCFDCFVPYRSWWVIIVTKDFEERVPRVPDLIG